MMVAESTNALSPITFDTCLGERTFCSPTELHSAIGELYRAVNQSNLQAAKAYFALGEMLVKGHDELCKKTPKASMRGLINSSGVHPQKGKRAIKWYSMLKDPDDGSFSHALYEEGAHEVADAIRNGELKGKLDAAGHPSIRAHSNHFGLNGSVAKRKSLGRVQDTCVPLQGSADPDAEMWGSIESLAETDHGLEKSPTPETTTPRTRPSPFTSSGRAAGAAGDQMMIDFDFRASGQSIHDSLDAVAELADRGTLDPAHAAGVQRKVDELLGYIGTIGHHAQDELEDEGA